MEDLVFAASVFTTEADPPRTISPWTSHTNPPAMDQSTHLRNQSHEAAPASHVHPGEGPSYHLSSTDITRLAPEPQEGPTEYKLHLLMHPRRHFTSSSTGLHVPGSKSFQSPQYVPPPSSAAATDSPSAVSLSTNNSTATHKKRRSPSSTATGSTTQSKAARLKSLTTQLLWRLQQSSPCHHLPADPQRDETHSTPAPALAAGEQILTDIPASQEPKPSSLFAPSAIPPRGASKKGTATKDISGPDARPADGAIPAASVNKGFEVTTEESHKGKTQQATLVDPNAVPSRGTSSGAGYEASKPQLMGTRGAYYEIGVADDGSLIGLLEDEVAESLETLKLMAGELGCEVEVQRRVCVGWAGWRGEVATPGTHDSGVSGMNRMLGGGDGASAGGGNGNAGAEGIDGGAAERRGDLWVVEAFVKPRKGDGMTGQGIAVGA